MFSLILHKIIYQPHRVFIICIRTCISTCPPTDYLQAYATSASFVPQLTQTVLRYLDPQPTDRVLDIGCGDGKFTAHFLPSVAYVLGVDASPAMIEHAVRNYAFSSSEEKKKRAEFRVVDCRFLEREREILDGRWDKV